MIDNRELMYLLGRIAKSLESIDESLKEKSRPSVNELLGNKPQWEKMAEAPIKCEVTE